MCMCVSFCICFLFRPIRFWKEKSRRREAVGTPWWPTLASPQRLALPNDHAWDRPCRVVLSLLPEKNAVQRDTHSQMENLENFRLSTYHEWMRSQFIRWPVSLRVNKVYKKARTGTTAPKDTKLSWGSNSLSQVPTSPPPPSSNCGYCAIKSKMFSDLRIRRPMGAKCSWLAASKLTSRGADFFPPPCTSALRTAHCEWEKSTMFSSRLFRLEWFPTPFLGERCYRFSILVFGENFKIIPLNQQINQSTENRSVKSVWLRPWFSFCHFRFIRDKNVFGATVFLLCEISISFKLLSLEYSLVSDAVILHWKFLFFLTLFPASSLVSSISSPATQAWTSRIPLIIWP